MRYLSRLRNVGFIQLAPLVNNVVSLALDSTGKSLVTGGNQGTVCLFVDIGVKNPEPTFIYRTTGYGINSVSFSQDNKLIAIAQADGQVLVVNLQGKQLAKFQPTKKSDEEKLILDVSFNRDNTRLVTAGKNGDIKLWKLEDLEKSPMPEVSFLSDIPVKPLVVRPLSCWNTYRKMLEESNISCEKTKTSKKPNDGIPFLKIGFKKTGELLVVAENNDILSVLEYSEDNKGYAISGIKLNGYGEQVTGNVLKGAGFNFENDYLFTISGSLLQRWNLGKKPESPIIVAKGEENFTTLSLRDKSEKDEPTVSLLTINDGKKLQAWGSHGKQVPIDEKNMINKKMTPLIKNVSFISQGEFVTIGEDDQIWRWDVKPSSLIPIPIKNKIENITSIATTSFNNLIAVGNKQGMIDVIDFSGSSLLQPKAPVQASIGGLVSLINLSKDGKHLVSVVADKVSLWDISNPATPLKKQILNENSTTFQGGINDIRFNHNNTHIALIAGKENKIKFFKLSGKDDPDYDESISMVLDDDGGNGISFSQSNKLFPNLSLKQPLLAAASKTGKVKVWDWQTRKLIAQFTSKLTTIHSIEISSDGTELFLGGGDDEGGKVEKWPISNLDKLITKGCDWLKDYHGNSSQSTSVKAKCAEQLNPKK